MRLLVLLVLSIATLLAEDLDLASARNLIDRGRFVRIREIAEQTLRENKNSVMGNYLMGVAMHRGEANLPLARYYLGRARTLVEQAELTGFDANRSELHSNVLFEMLLVAGLTEKHDEQLKIVAEFNELFRIDMGERTGWALMKMGRHEEALKLMRHYVQSKDPDVRRGALNTLGSIEMTLGNYEEAFRWFTILKSELTERDRVNIATLVRNRAEVATVLLRFQEAEADTLYATKHFHPSSNSNPWMSLAILYVGQGRLAESLGALRNMHSWDKRSDPTLEQQRWNDGQQATAIILMAAGYNTEALNILRKIRNKPDRRGVTSGNAEQAEIGLLYLYREALQLQREQIREEMSWNTISEWALAVWERLKIERELWEANSRLNSLLVPQSRLNWILRPYAPDSPIVEWMRPGLHIPVGDGLAEVELQKLLARTGKNSAREKPYLQAALGETLVSQGAYAKGLTALTAARNALPQEEVMLRTRAEVLIGYANERLGQSDASVTAYRNALERNPGLFRTLDLTVPVTFSPDGSEAAKQTVAFLEKSPRFHRGRGFNLSVFTAGNRIAARLSGRDGTVFMQASVVQLPDTKLTARMLAKEIHRKAFAAKVDLSQADINSLDGSTTAGDAMQLKEMFGIQ
jgi:tetratricopeptide (TPR) repeat protein